MTDLIYYITFFSLTTLVSLYLNGYLNKLFVGNKLTDPVNERSSHNYPATRSGGLSIFFTVCIASAFAGGGAFALARAGIGATATRQAMSQAAKQVSKKKNGTK